MPILDMPLEKLKEYHGRSPKPADFDSFWDKAIAEMKSVDPKIELAPSDFTLPRVECFDLYFTGVGNARIHAKLARPKDPAERNGAGVVIFHGYAYNSGDWLDKLAYAGAGFTVAALDCRGQGGKSEDNGSVIGNTLRGHIIRGLSDSPAKLLFRNIYLDCAQLAYLVMAMPGVDPSKVGAFGVSQGGGLTMACAGLVPELNRAAPVYPFLSDFKRVWEMDLALNAYAELRDYFRLFDPRHEHEEKIFTRLGYIDIQNLAPRVKCRIKMFTGLMDSTCPPSTQFAAYNKVTSSKSMEIFPDFGHENLPGHSDDIFQYMLEMVK